MEAADVIDILTALDDAGVRVWVDGGWGIDALLGARSRPHADLDLVIDAGDVALARGVLADAGFSTVLRDWLPTALALADDRGRQVDLHPVTPTPDGGGDQHLPAGASFHYPAPVAGVIDGRAVRCVFLARFACSSTPSIGSAMQASLALLSPQSGVDAATQVRCHLGYPPTGTDRHDMALLRERLGVRLPEQYRLA
ncbi:MAG: hypothetical protein J2O49_00650 [Sciscionella sp.]|nr:hypothetical protein [Sciscionella sp.]